MTLKETKYGAKHSHTVFMCLCGKILNQCMCPDDENDPKEDVVLDQCACQKRKLGIKNTLKLPVRRSHMPYRKGE